MPKVTAILPRLPALPPRQRVAAYARVSKDSEQLMHSLSAQVSYYSDLIQLTPGWDFVGVYVDAGLTGTNTETRPEFRRMIDDCEAGKIDIVLTKSISRFARNTVDLLATVRRLKELGIEVRFEKEHINSLSGDGEVMLSILASFAQEESTSLSKNIKWRIQKKYEEGRVHTHQKMLGYRWEGDEMVVVPEEAETVRFIFDAYISGMGCKAISNELKRRGVISVRGKPFEKETVVKVLENEQYTGCLILQQTYNYLPNKMRVNHGELAMYRVDEHHPAIISEEVFTKARAEKEQRGAEAQARTTHTPFSRIVWCGKCGGKCSSHKNRWGHIFWLCNSRHTKRDCDCASYRNDVVLGALESLGLGTDDVDRVTIFDGKIVFKLINGRSATWKQP